MLVAAAAESVGRRRWKCHLRLGWPRLRLMALSGIRRQVSRGGRLGIGRAGCGGGDWRGRKGPALFQAALGLRPPSAALFEAWPGLGSQLSIPFSFPPVGWSRARLLFLVRPNVSLTSAPYEEGRGNAGLHVDLGSVLGVKSEALGFPRAGNQCAGTTGSGRGSIVAVRGLREFKFC